MAVIENTNIKRNEDIQDKNKDKCNLCYLLFVLCIPVLFMFHIYTFLCVIITLSSDKKGIIKERIKTLIHQTFAMS